MLSNSLELPLLFIGSLPKTSCYLALDLLDLELSIVEQFLLSVRCHAQYVWISDRVGTLFTQTMMRME